MKMSQKAHADDNGDEVTLDCRLSEIEESSGVKLE
jgi:hypothetical protein